jgi:diadenosine tetraphosphate (Ap4A) HIT family hydrolase
MIVAAKKFAAEQGVHDFKLIFNAGRYVEVPHLHLHILCGEIKNS